jgi:hypothetical protein
MDYKIILIIVFSIIVIIIWIYVCTNCHKLLIEPIDIDIDEESKDERENELSFTEIINSEHIV